MRRLEAASALARQTIAAPTTDRLSLEPAVPNEAKNARADQPFAHPERRHQTDQSGKPDHASVRGERIAPDGDDQRTRARRIRRERSANPARNERVGRIDFGVTARAL